MSREIWTEWPEDAVFNDHNMTVTFVLEDGEQDPEFTRKIKWAVCPTCDGRGKHVNSSVDSQGISPEEFEHDPDFERDYFEGVYDVTCNECRGKRVVPELAEPCPELEAWQRERRQWAAERLNEIRMGY